MLGVAFAYVVTAAAILAKVAIVAALAVCTLSLIAALRRGRRE
jgi:hypothetical protein